MSATEQSPENDALAEGWALPVPSARKFHYFVAGRSLCGRYGYWGPLSGPLSQNVPGLAPGPNDCVTCHRKRVTPPERKQS